jgi:hypothetical protein
MVFFSGGILALLLLALGSFGNTIQRTARQLERAAATLEDILNNEGKALLDRGDKVLREFESVLPVAKERITQISPWDKWYAYLGSGSPLERSLVLWMLKEAWRKVQTRRKEG